MQLWLITSYGQNFLFQNQSFFNPYLTNPALAGSQGKGNIGIIYKKQLVDFENGPNSQVISIDYPFLRNTTGLGFNILKDQKLKLKVISSLMDRNSLRLCMQFHLCNKTSCCNTQERKKTRPV